MLTVQKISPSPSLQEYIRHYEYRQIISDDRVAVRPLPARPEQLLQFNLLDQFEYLDQRSGTTSIAPAAVVVGPQTYRMADLFLKGRFRVFVIVFQPTGFHRLFHLPMTELTDHAHEASAVVGGEASVLHQRLFECATVGGMVRAAEDFLLGPLTAVQPFHPLQRAAAHILMHNGQVDLDRLVHLSGLSQRQFERKFIDQVGMPAKFYARINRFQYALRLKEEHPSRSWTDITYEAGYFDQAHLVKDFKSLAGDTPSNFLSLLISAPDLVLKDSLDELG